MDHFSAPSQLTAKSVIKVALQQIISRFGLVENINSDNGSHFTSKELKGIMEGLDSNWNYHTSCHSLFSGKVERINQSLKKHITKLILETKLPWTKCLPIALLRIITTPRKDVVLSPYEMLYGLLYLGSLLIYQPFRLKINF